MSKKAENTFELAVVKFGKNPAHCVYLNDYRIAGQKPWGGGEYTSSWQVTLSDLQKAIPKLEVTAPDPRIAALEAEVARLRGQIECLTSPDIFWGEDGEDFADGDYVDIWQGGVFQVSVGKLLGFRYAAYIPSEIDPETGAFDAGDVEYFPTEAEAIAAQDAAVAALNPAPSEKEAG